MWMLKSAPHRIDEISLRCAEAVATAKSPIAIENNFLIVRSLKSLPLILRSLPALVSAKIQVAELLKKSE